MSRHYTWEELEKLPANTQFQPGDSFDSPPPEVKLTVMEVSKDQRQVKVKYKAGAITIQLWTDADNLMGSH